MNVKVVKGKWRDVAAAEKAPPEELQTQEDKNVENKWKKYVEQKKTQKEQKMKQDLLLQGLSEAERLKHLEPVSVLIENIKK
eukprot:CAMPEP_0185599382 /NCGR_PEP_ID=MMETSP0434-20130131/82668_1 /TAXON_ID=626734 ORGANISM="Favella taraikaensis, Strain Fe Narragansett Bay" /NCGR_SAMPLE_ID=MMETSP0434 /ASSEMBLY_ACC=CAM_ASM_000379 /LENGTH=81 /DNA_ID=CAMNT_0028228769 /DNA_START=2694 /DNA_END=2939 /DNA_ORIENTATION=+